MANEPSAAAGEPDDTSGENVAQGGSNKELHGDEVPDSPWFSDANDSLVNAVEPDTSDQLRYSVASLMIATGLVAVSIVLLKWLSLVGLLVMLLSMLIGNYYMRSKKYPGRHKIECGMWGIVLPLLCIIYDPGFLHEGWYQGSVAQIFVELENLWEDRRGMFVLPPILWQCLSMAVWLALKPQLKSVGGFFSGMFHIGSGIAAIIGICLLPFSCLGLLAFGLGLLGFTPFWTATIYHRVGAEAYFCDLETPRKRSMFNIEARLALGVITAIAAPLTFSLWATETTFEELVLMLEYATS